MTNTTNISIIAQAINHSNTNGNAVLPRFQGLLNDLQEEQLAEQVVVNHGLLEATRYDIEDEIVSLDSLKHEEVEDFDNDESLVDMDSVSGSLRDIFND